MGKGVSIAVEAGGSLRHAWGTVDVGSEGMLVVLSPHPWWVLCLGLVVGGAETLPLFL